MGMSDGFEERRIVAHGSSTRAVQLTTGERASFAPEAVHDLVRQARLYGEMLDQFIAYGKIDDPLLPDVDAGPWPAVVEVSLGVEARNFDPDTWKDAVAECPLPIK